MEYFTRFFLDIAFYALITIILLSIVFAIIYDTFYSLRSDFELMEYDVKNICYICNIDR